MTDDVRAELDQARRFRSLPDGYVWQDYYSPDEVIRIREGIEAERDAALATLQQVRARIELAETWSRYLVPEHNGALIDADNVDTLLEDLAQMIIDLTERIK
ncbi:hypothetical protein WOJTEK_86 [Gordonia phage Wojtek]|uniref:Uncharacterized protein n=1 Tax=Gordonia phage Wojtek TaxID=2910758 RepID=A0AA49BNT3_9CAUD|nr:hypothetical protein WOJTEK_86 [Gordonia phage Wojtek]